MGKVVYLTGAPASGKSSLSRLAQAQLKDLALFCYSERLRDFINGRLSADGKLSEEGIRQQSAKVVTRNDVLEVDELLIQFVQDERARNDVIIDSHAVTKESYGFRITGFTVDKLEKLSPDVIVCLYADPETTAARISADAAGRPSPSLYEFAMHTSMQAGLASQYGTLLGKPVYLLDSTKPREELLSIFLACTGMKK